MNSYSGKFRAALAAGAVFFSLLQEACRNEGLQYGDWVNISGRVIEVHTGQRGRDILLRSGDQLYHISTKRSGRWKNVDEGNSISVYGQHGGECEEDFVFTRVFGNASNGEYKGSMRAPVKIANVVLPGNFKSKDVIDIIYANVIKQ